MQQDKVAKRSMKDLKKAIQEIATSNPNGFTVKLPTLENVTKGFISAYEDTQNCFGNEGLEKVIDHATNHDNTIGGWLNEDDQQYYFDSCKVFENEKEAIEFGKENKQIAIFDLNNLKEIRL